MAFHSKKPSTGTMQRSPMSPGRGTITGRVMLERRTIHIPDVLDDPEYEFIEGQKTGGYRTILGVPLMREGAAIGVLIIGRSIPRPFTAQQIDLAQTFADQAVIATVIAIENVRLFDEIQDKNRQLQLASENKSQFFSNMSHELRTPLNAIIGLTEMMVTNAARFGTEKALEPLRRVNAAGFTDRTQLLVGEISRMRAQSMRVGMRGDEGRLADSGNVPEPAFVEVRQVDQNP
jgi:GAF domain-containing protein